MVKRFKEDLPPISLSKGQESINKDNLSISLNEEINFDDVQEIYYGNSIKPGTISGNVARITTHDIID